jgi:hypothetical protein
LLWWQSVKSGVPQGPLAERSFGHYRYGGDHVVTFGIGIFPMMVIYAYVFGSRGTRIHCQHQLNPEIDVRGGSRLVRFLVDWKVVEEVTRSAHDLDFFIQVQRTGKNSPAQREDLTRYREDPIFGCKQSFRPFGAAPAPAATSAVRP